MTRLEDTEIESILEDTYAQKIEPKNLSVGNVIVVVGTGIGTATEISLILTRNPSTNENGSYTCTGLNVDGEYFNLTFLEHPPDGLYVVHSAGMTFLGTWRLANG